jgi:predicted tellurium resistance membrane protein TerC
MLALLSLLVAVPLARFVSSLRMVVIVQAAICVLAGIVLVATAPDHDSSRTTGFLLALVLVPVTALAVAIGRVWRTRSTRTLDAVG